jgi:hypothetical protein
MNDAIKKNGGTGIRIENVSPGLWAAGCERKGRRIEKMGATRDEAAGKLLAAVRHAADSEAFS